jgi:2-polyprenyl-6-methoxyphenol hydroxylase-like FAD-dependent oxidoreductase
MSASPVREFTTVCIAGCGPAGAMLGLMLARAGIDVVVLEKYPDFFRDFRGDTIHASTLQVLADLDLLSGFEKLPQQRTTSIAMMTDEGMVTLADFTHLPGHFQYLSMVPQWDFLSFITGEAKQYPSFTLCTETEAVGVIERDGAVRGVRYRVAGDSREHELQALLTVAADGRHSTVRKVAGLRPVEFGAPMDLLWYRIPKRPGDPEGSFARIVPGRLFPMIDRRTYWQGAYTMPKGSFATLKAGGIETLRADLRRAMPFMGDRIEEALRSWDDTGFLEVRVNRLQRWYRPGLLCIGDAAHAMSPVAGVGINLAIQDAVATANILAGPLRDGTLTEADLARIQRRRWLPTWLTQRVQLVMQRQIVRTIVDADARGTVPRQMRLLARVRPLLRLLSRFMAIGVRNERVSPAFRRPASGSAQPAVAVQSATGR